MPTSSVKLTFLPWIVDEHKNKHEKQLQISKRHQHTALAGHQRQREQGKRLRRSKSCLTSSVSPDQSSRSTTNGLRNVTRWSSPMADDNGFIEPRAGVLPSPTLMSASFSGMNLFDEVQLSGEFKRHLDDALTHQWPAFALASTDGAVTKIRESAFQTAATSPHTLFAMVYAGACYRSYFNATRISGDGLLQLQAKQQALKYLRKAVQESDGSAADEVLMTISLLAIHGSVQTSKQPRFTAPLFRDNEFYSTVKFDPIHLRALRVLVADRGGLAKLELHGLNNILSMIDTFQALVNLAKPYFEPLYCTEAIGNSLQAIWDDVSWSRFTNQVEGFRFLTDLGDGPQLLGIISQLRVFLETYAFSLRNPRLAPDIMLMIHFRRSLQHDVLRLGSTKNCLVEATRISIIILLAALGWTLPVDGRFQEKATELLFLALTECGSLGYWQDHPEFLLWATVIGGVVARDSSRVWDFVLMLLQQSHIPVTKDSWFNTKTLSYKFLPFEYELTVPCHDFWDRACDLLSGLPAKASAPP